MLTHIWLYFCFSLVCCMITCCQIIMKSIQGVTSLSVMSKEYTFHEIQPLIYTDPCHPSRHPQWHCIAKASQNSIRASHQSGQRWKSDLTQLGDPVFFPYRAESSGGLAKLYDGLELLWAEWCRIHVLDPTQLQDSLLELKNAGPRTLLCGSHIQHCHSLMMVVWQRLHAAGGELTFSNEDPSHRETGQGCKGQADIIT